MKINITIANPLIISDIWEIVYPFLKPAVDEDIFVDEESLKSKVLNDQAIMFVATADGKITGTAIVCIDEFKSSVATILALGGKDLKHWEREMNEAITIYATEMKCDMIVALGVKGWQRVWKDFTPGKILYYKRVA